jgi:hypothetical protein
VSKGFWTAPPDTPEFYNAVRWLERVQESTHPSAPLARTALDALRSIYFQDKKEREHLQDTALGKETFVHSLLGLKERELADLQYVTHHSRFKNHGVVIRNLIKQEAKRIRQELKDAA